MFSLIWIMLRKIRSKETRIGSTQMSSMWIGVVRSMRFIRVKRMHGVLQVLNPEFNVIQLLSKIS